VLEDEPEIHDEEAEAGLTVQDDFTPVVEVVHHDCVSTFQDGFKPFLVHVFEEAEPFAPIPTFSQGQRR